MSLPTHQGGGLDIPHQLLKNQVPNPPTQKGPGRAFLSPGRAEQQRATPKDLPGEDWLWKIKTILCRMELDSRLDAYAQLVGRYARNSVSLEHAHMVSRGSTDGYYEVAKYEL